MSIDKRVLTPEWPAGGHYSQAIVAGRLVFLAGQTAGTPGTDELAAMDVTEQTRGCIDRMERLLHEAGGGLSDVVKTTCFLADIRDFGTFNAVYANAFPAPPPVRSTVQVGFPEGLLVEIEAIALIDR
jgi:2-iminobutanoate/2-iminopropanoate deaminase